MNTNTNVLYDISGFPCYFEITQHSYFNLISEIKPTEDFFQTTVNLVKSL